MSTRVIFDAEANGLLETVDTVWCICTINPDTGDRYRFVHPLYHTSLPCTGDISSGLVYLNSFDEIIGHNIIGYDLELFDKVLGWKPRPEIKITDTVILSRLVNFDIRIPPGCTSGPHSVEAYGIRFGRHKPGHEDWTQFSAEMLHRCSEDTEIQLLIWCHVYQEMGKGGDWDFAIWLEHEFAKIIIKQNLRGWLFDSNKAAELIKKLDDEMHDCYNEIESHLPYIVTSEGELKKPLTSKNVWNKYAGDWVNKVLNIKDGDKVRQDGPDHIIVSWKLAPSGLDRYQWSIGGPLCRVSFDKVNIGSHTQLKPWLLSIGWKPTERNIDKKTHKPSSPKLTEESYGSLKVGVGPHIAQYLKCKHRRQMIEGWFKVLRIDGRLPAPSTSLGTPTGRQAHKVIVNVPNEDSYLGPELRSLFLATPGYVIVGGDSKSCQARLLCHRIEDDKFTDAVVNGKKENGTDLHGYNMKLLGVPKSDAKGFFYAFCFGAQAAKISSIIGKSKKEAQRMMDIYFEKLPTLKATIESLTTFWKEQGHIVGMDGRLVRPRKAHEVLCYDLQMGESISVKLAIILTDMWAKAEGIENHLLIAMHDEAQYDVLPEQAPRFSEILKLAFSEAGRIMNLTVPLGGDVSIGNNWGETH